MDMEKSQSGEFKADAFLAIEDHLRINIAKEIRDLELPPEWRPSEVIRYIARKIEKSN
jgi:hypothetical protein